MGELFLAQKYYLLPRKRKKRGPGREMELGDPATKQTSKFDILNFCVQLGLAKKNTAIS